MSVLYHESGWYRVYWIVAGILGLYLSSPKLFSSRKAQVFGFRKTPCSGGLTFFATERCRHQNFGHLLLDKAMDRGLVFFTRFLLPQNKLPNLTSPWIGGELSAEQESNLTSTSVPFLLPGEPGNSVLSMCRKFTTILSEINPFC